MKKDRKFNLGDYYTKLIEIARKDMCNYDEIFRVTTDLILEDETLNRRTIQKFQDTAFLSLENFRRRETLPIIFKKILK